jgi:copper resistance protein C
VSTHPARVRSLVAVLAAAGALLLVAAPSASAHDVFISSTPANGSTLTSPPTAIVLTFEEPPTTSGLAVALTAPDGTVSTLAPTLAGAVVTAPVTGTLAPGAYTVAWRVVADDGHPLTGTLAFTFAAPSTSASTSASATSAAASPVATTTAAGAPSTSSVGAGWWIALGAVVVLAVGAVVVLGRRRRS